MKSSVPFKRSFKRIEGHVDTKLQIELIKPREAMNRPIAILLLVLIIAGLIFSTFALFQGKFGLALIVYPLLIAAFVFLRLGKKE